MAAIELSALALLLALAATPAAADECYRVDTAASTLSFRIDQAGSPFQGRFRRFGGRVCLARSRVTRVDVWVAPGSIDTGVAKLDRALQGEAFFAAARYPRATFASDSIATRGGAELARGTLEIKGKGRGEQVPFTLQLGAMPTVSGAFTIDRLAYGIGTGAWANTKWLGKEVAVTFKATLAPAQSRRAAESSLTRPARDIVPS